MALARLITRTPEYAQKLAASLQSAGYEIEFVSPDDHADLPADLEVNLDDPSAAASYIVTSDGREISFAYDEFEREFVLAPLWRKVKTALRPFLPHRKSEDSAAESQVLMAPEDLLAQPLPVASKVERATFAVHDPIPDEDLAATTVLEAVEPPAAAEPVVQSSYIPQVIAPEPEPRFEFSGKDLFDGQGTRRIAEEPAPETTPVLTDPPIAAPTEPQPYREPWPVVMARRAATLGTNLRESWQVRTSEVRSRLGEHDAAWLRAVPVAAVIVFAFLLGWGYANSGSSKARSAPPEIVDAKPADAAAPVQRPKKLSPASAAPAKRIGRRPARVAAGEEPPDDVVIRHLNKHYPSKGVRASNEKTVRRYSDIQ